MAAAESAKDHGKPDLRGLFGEELRKNTSILCVEDEAIILEGMRIVLRRRFNSVYTATNGKEGFAIFENNKVDIVITDILMPIMDGLEMATKIKKISPDTPILILSALNEEPFLKKAAALGLYDYIAKPYCDDDFFEILYRVAFEVHKRKNKVFAAAAETEIAELL
ncbi:response regulator transcription factor [Candidatus Magnetominusculus dajiuhuensis]|uniref:response regulator transcription factor n=1 Tax=Candidatus Magnetominusculus dajiuhuensis TaxID=3137712 RepID=UPI003B42FC62